MSDKLQTFIHFFFSPPPGAGPLFRPSPVELPNAIFLKLPIAKHTPDPAILPISLTYSPQLYLNQQAVAH